MHTGHLATGTAMVLFPIGAPGQAPTRWLLFVTAVERCNDPRATKLAPGEAFILSRPKGAKQWEHRRVLGPAAQQYFADWRREWTVGRGADRLPAGGYNTASAWERVGEPEKQTFPKTKTKTQTAKGGKTRTTTGTTAT